MYETKLYDYSTGLPTHSFHSVNTFVKEQLCRFKSYAFKMPNGPVKSSIEAKPGDFL